MSGKVTKHMAMAYLQDAPAAAGFSSYFVATPDSFYTSETIEFDIEREGEDVAPVLTDIKDGFTKFALDQYTNKEWKAPVIKEKFSLNTYDMIKRQAGENPFVQPDFRANAVSQFQRHMTYGGKRQRRTMELMASQIMQDGIVTLKDDQGADTYILDFQVKATHLPTSTVAWDQAGSTKIVDLLNLCNVVRQDGQSRPTGLKFGEGSWVEFIQDEEVQKLLDNRRMELGGIAPANAPEGMVYMGWIWIGSYRLDMYTYPEYYKDVGSATTDRYLRDESVVVIAEGFVGSKTFGAIPMIVPPESRAMGFLAGRMPMPGIGMDFTTNAWVTPDGETVNGSIGSRPLLIPKSIDRYGCLNTGI